MFLLNDRLIAAFISVLAFFIAFVMCFVRQVSLYETLLRSLIAGIVFLVIGLVIGATIKNLIVEAFVLDEKKKEEAARPSKATPPEPDVPAGPEQK